LRSWIGRSFCARIFIPKKSFWFSYLLICLGPTNARRDFSRFYWNLATSSAKHGVDQVNEREKRVGFAHRFLFLQIEEIEVHGSALILANDFNERR
jgi:hypothetical protein